MRIAIPLVVLAILAMLSGVFERQAEYNIKEWEKFDGVKYFNFKTRMSPAIPDNPQSPEDFRDIFKNSGLSTYLNNTTDFDKGRDSYSWLLDNDYKVVVTSKTCKDDVLCVDAIQLHPDSRTRAMIHASKSKKMMFITPEDYSLWPYTVDWVVVTCHRGTAVTITHDNKDYTLNGLATAHFPRMENSKLIRKKEPSVPGTYMGNARILNDGLALCNN